MIPIQAPSLCFCLFLHQFPVGYCAVHSQNPRQEEGQVSAPLEGIVSRLKAVTQGLQAHRRHAQSLRLGPLLRKVSLSLSLPLHGFLRSVSGPVHQVHCARAGA